jgi:hypothetical protein
VREAERGRQREGGREGEAERGRQREGGREREAERGRLSSQRISKRSNGAHGETRSGYV